jgi:hypothetical protein
MPRTVLRAAMAAAGCRAHSTPALAHDGPHREWLESRLGWGNARDGEPQLRPSPLLCCGEARPDIAQHFVRVRAGI